MLVRALILLILPIAVHANIEQVRFFAPFTTSNAVLPPALAPSSPSTSEHSNIFPLSFARPAQVKTVNPLFAHDEKSKYATEEYYLLTDLSKGSFYEFRVCWPANQPLDLKVGVVKASQMDKYSDLYVSPEDGDAMYAFIKYSSFYFTDVPLLMETPAPVTFELILSKCTFLVVLGDSVVMQSLLVILGVFGWIVALNNECQTAFQELKLGRSLKFIIFSLNATKTEIVVLEKSADKSYDEFLSKLPENDCRYAVYDFEYELAGGEGKRSKILFFTWSPDSAPVRSKMTYASSKDAIRRALNGIAIEIQGTDFSEVAYESVLDKVSKGPGSH
ncbi:Cofilin/tropomyosin-type actin-binding protein-domain-containing protein [Limtongia smithiae]|uniref:Cofilin/tropomyosin-type actin-binding protein-domain-containing protein n=1 Tax=Limtongia smithiae TaxID=1125753 RepID=UPI0034CEE696